MLFLSLLFVKTVTAGTEGTRRVYRNHLITWAHNNKTLNGIHILSFLRCNAMYLALLPDTLQFSGL